MTARRYITGCALAAAVAVAGVLAATAYLNHESGRTHRRARGMR